MELKLSAVSSHSPQLAEDFANCTVNLVGGEGVNTACKLHNVSETKAK